MKPQSRLASDSWDDLQADVQISLKSARLDPDYRQQVITDCDHCGVAHFLNTSSSHSPLLIAQGVITNIKARVGEKENLTAFSSSPGIPLPLVDIIHVSVICYE